MKMRIAPFALIPLLPCACGTGLKVTEVSRKGDLAKPGGLVINQWMVYEVDVAWNGNGEDKPEILSEGPLTGVDVENVLVINICRQPFASGELTMGLEGAQRPKSIGLTGSPGVLTGATAASKGVEAAKEIQKAQDEED